MRSRKYVSRWIGCWVLTVEDYLEEVVSLGGKGVYKGENAYDEFSLLEMNGKKE